MFVVVLVVVDVVVVGVVVVSFLGCAFIARLLVVVVLEEDADRLVVVVLEEDADRLAGILCLSPSHARTTETLEPKTHTQNTHTQVARGFVDEKIFS